MAPVAIALAPKNAVNFIDTTTLDYSNASHVDEKVNRHRVLQQALFPQDYQSQSDTFFDGGNREVVVIDAYPYDYADV